MDENQKMVTFSVKITQENRDKLHRIKDELNTDVFNDVFDNIIARFYSPIKVNEENKVKIETLTQELDQLKNDYDVLQVNHDARASDCTELSKQVAEYKKAFEDLAKKGELKLSDFLSDNQCVFTIEPLHIAVLDYVAKVEGKRRGQDWTTSDVVNYFIHSRFIKGDLNGNLNSVPDSVIAKLKKEL